MNGVSAAAWRARLALHLWLHRHTAWPGLALALVIVACAVWLLVLQPLHHQVIELRSRAAAEGGRREQASAGPAVVQTATSSTVEPQVSRLLGDDAVTVQLLEQLFVLAGQHGLQLRRGEYKPAQWRSIRVNALQITLPLQGNYATLRGWIVDVLSQVPQASIDRISMRRDDVKSDLLEADVVLTLWRKAPGSYRHDAPAADKTAATSTGKQRP
jgi:hypothetical protein